MPSEMEFKTTMQDVQGDPKPPKGDGWSLAGASPALMRVDGTEHIRAFRVFMHWQRPVRRTSRECKRCNAVAFAVDGTCLGCRQPYRPEEAD